MISRRSLITGLIAFAVAPAIARAASLMPVKVIEPIYPMRYAPDVWTLEMIEWAKRHIQQVTEIEPVMLGEPPAAHYALLERVRGR